jgi:hypothetical protein
MTVNQPVTTNQQQLLAYICIAQCNEGDQLENLENLENLNTQSLKSDAIREEGKKESNYYS